MKLRYQIPFIIFILFFVVSCVDDGILPDNFTGKEFNIPEFSEGYSIAFDVTLDDMGDPIEDSWDAELRRIENYLNPEEFRVLFFTKDNQFLFESTSRWFTAVDSKDGGNRWRVGVPIFQYLGDWYDDKGDHEDQGYKVNYEYNWKEIARIMREKGFKIAVLANRPTKVEVPTLSDWPSRENDGDQYTSDQYNDFDHIKNMNVADNGPFWTPLNSVATSCEELAKIDEKYKGYTEEKRKEDIETRIASIIDLHHCQFDPLYYGKSVSKNNDNKGDKGGCYDFIMNWDEYKDPISDYVFKSAPYMGAASSWISNKRRRRVITKTTDASGTVSYDDRSIRYYRLPLDHVQTEWSHGGGGEDDDANVYDGYDLSKDKDGNVCGSLDPDEDQYIPMYGIQEYDALTTWKEGTTFQLSEQTGGQTGEYKYKSIFLLRSVVKLELRIPWYDAKGDELIVDNGWAQLWFQNYMARCEPMDVMTPTNQIWHANHGSDCEWNYIRDYGLFANATIPSGKNDFRERLSWYYGVWKEADYEFSGYNFTSNKVYVDGKNPRIFNPLTQRLQGVFITDCYLPIEGKYHRWVIYCGEKNMNDPNYLGYFVTGKAPDNKGLISIFRIKVSTEANPEGFILNIPITDYNNTEGIKKTGGKYNNPAYDCLKETGGDIKAMKNESSIVTAYEKAIRDTNGLSPDYYPFPLLRNHFYRLTVSFGDSEDDINVKIINPEKRTIGGIIFK